MKLGVFTVSLPEYTPEECLEKIHEHGYEGVQWRIIEDNGDKSVPGYWSGNRNSMSLKELQKKTKQLNQLANSLNVSMESLGTYVESQNLDDVKKHFEIAKMLDAKSVRINTGYYNDSENFQKQINRLRKQYEKVCKLAEKYDLKALIETRVGQLTPSIGKSMIVLQGLPPEHVGILWDPSNQIEEGLESYQMAIDTAGKYLAQVHVKNKQWEHTEFTDPYVKWKTSNCPIHKGIVNWPSLISLLKKSKYKGWLYFEDFSTNNDTDYKLKYNKNGSKN